MKLENQICRLSQARRLKELGVIQNQSFCFWGKRDNGEFFAVPHKIAKAAFDLFWDNEQYKSKGIAICNDVLVIAWLNNEHSEVGISKKEAEANARLIASAPTLHADNKALRKVLERVVGMSDDAYLTGHPEFVSIADEAKEILNRLNK